MDRFGRDAPDMRFGMEHTTLDWSGTEFRVVAGAIEGGGIVKAMVVKGAVEGTSRKVLDGWTEFVKRYRLGGLLWGKVTADGWTGPLSKVEEQLQDLKQRDWLTTEALPVLRSTIVEDIQKSWYAAGIAKRMTVTVRRGHLQWPSRPNPHRVAVSCCAAY